MASRSRRPVNCPLIRILSGRKWRFVSLNATDIVPRTKLQALFRHLTKLKDEDTHLLVALVRLPLLMIYSHAVVFSQFTSFLDMCVTTLRDGVSKVDSIEQLMVKEGIK